MIATSRKNLTLGATLCTLAMVAGYVWICRGDQPATKQVVQGEIEKTRVRSVDSPPKIGKGIARSGGDEPEEQSANLTIKNPTKPEPPKKIVRGRENPKPKKNIKDPAC